MEGTSAKVFFSCSKNLYHRWHRSVVRVVSVVAVVVGLVEMVRLVRLVRYWFRVDRLVRLV